MTSRSARAAAAVVAVPALLVAGSATAQADPAQPDVPTVESPDAHQSPEAHEAHVVHDGVGVVTVEGRHPTSASEVHYVVRLTWSADGHPADDTTALSASLVGLDGVPQPAVAFQPYGGDGRFAGTVAFPGPGVWTLRFTSAHPPTTVDSLEVFPVLAAPLPFV